ncbi:MAG: DUF2062 domain-containing protein [Agarilytica sp.]
MPRKLFKRWIPSHHKIREIQALKFLGTLLHDPNLFHLNRHSVSVAFFIGLFLAFLPIPLQIPLGALCAILFHCNLPITVALVWISNPLTFPIIFIACYKLGARILDLPHREFKLDLTFTWLQSEFLVIWQPLLLGCLLSGLFFGCLGYVSIQWTWRWHVVKRWEKRKLKRLKRQANSSK